jgi:thiamine biosynthesis protein ThiI
VVVARIGEIFLKGGNRKIFVRALLQNLRLAVTEKCKITYNDYRFNITEYDPKDENLIIEKISRVFGIVSSSPCVTVSHDKILEHMKQIAKGLNGTFRVNVNRADKNFKTKSMDFAAKCGEVILHENKSLKVDLHNPQNVISVDIRPNNSAIIFDRVIPAAGGMPYGTAGRALVLLSGGIDSPVATYLAAKRGLSVECVHFSSPPYTSAASFDKVTRLTEKLREYCPDIKLHEISLTDVLTEIKKKCDPAYTITILRRFMIRHAVKLCQERGINCIVTGENLAQVASQTIHGITTTNAVAGDLPILRPLITYDKTEIITLAKKIGTYEISIEPHADCCTVFVPENPVIKPTIARCLREEKLLSISFENPF